MQPGDAGNPTSRSSTLAPTQLRPRNKRFISGFEEFAEENVKGSASNNPLASPYLTPYDSPNHSRAPSPIPSKHPSRSSTPARRSNAKQSSPPRSTREYTISSDQGNDLTNSLSGLWGKSWTSLQGLASNVLGSDASNQELFKDKARTRRPYEATHGRSDKVQGQWGPRSRDQSQQPGAGTSIEERQAAVRAKKRQELMAASANAYGNAANKVKRRMSDDFDSASAPPDEHGDRDVLVYVHNVARTDTLAGISIRYNCSMVGLKKANRLWSSDQILAKKHILLPVDACGIRGRQVAGLEEALPADLLGDDQKTPTPQQAPWSDTQASTTIRSAAQHSRHASSTSNGSQTAEQAWKHDSWILLEGFSEPTEIARIARREMGYFPRGRRKSVACSDLDTPSTSLDLHRPSASAAASDTSSGAPRSRTRRSSSAGQWAQQMQGPGGVGKLGGKGVPVPGPAQDKLNKVFSKHLPGMVTLNAGQNGTASEDVVPIQISQGLQKVGGAIESWMRDLAQTAAKAVEPALGAAHGSNHVDSGKRAFGLGSGRSGDLIELSNAFEVGAEEDHDEGDEDEEEEEERRTSADMADEERGRPRSTFASGSSASAGVARGRANGRTESQETIQLSSRAWSKSKGE